MIDVNMYLFAFELFVYNLTNKLIIIYNSITNINLIICK